MKKYAMFLALVVLLSGCAQREVKLENNGITITKFTADPTEVNDFNTVDFLLEIENVGSVVAENVEARLEGADTWRGSDRGKIDCRGNLQPPNPIDRIPGGLNFCIWSLTPPDLPEGAFTAFPIDARVLFNYRSTQAIVLKAINTDENRILRNKGQSVENPISVAQDDFSPVKIGITSGAIPLIIDPSPAAARQFPYRIEVRNVGDGWPITSGQLGKITGQITAIGPGITSSCDTSKIVLRADGTAPVLCTLTITDINPWSGGPRADSILFRADLAYGYFVKATSTVMVRGTSRGAGGTTTSVPGGTTTTTTVPGGTTTTVPGGTTTIRDPSTMTCWEYARSQGWPEPDVCEQNAGCPSNPACNACGGVGPRTKECDRCCDNRAGGTTTTVPATTTTLPTTTTTIVPRDCQAPPGNTGDKVYACTGRNPGCGSNAGEGIEFTCTGGDWRSPGYSSCYVPCDITPGAPCSNEGQQMYRCQGRSTGCLSDAGIGVPYVCTSGSWRVENPSGECVTLCKGIGTVW